MYDLFSETKEDGDDDGGLESLAEDDEKNGDGEEIFCHGERGLGLGGERGRILGQDIRVSRPMVNVNV